MSKRQACLDLLERQHKEIEDYPIAYAFDEKQLEEHVNNLIFGVSHYAECASRIAEKYAKTNYCIIEEDDNMTDLERLRTLIKAYPNCARRYMIECGANTSTHRRTRKPITIKNVIFNDPATIVFWSDGTKTVVKCQEGDEFDKEKGLAMAISKKSFGNKGNYFENFKKFCVDEEDDRAVDADPFTDFTKRVNKFNKELGDVFSRYNIKTPDIYYSDEE